MEENNRNSEFKYFPSNSVVMPFEGEDGKFNYVRFPDRFARDAEKANTPLYFKSGLSQVLEPRVGVLINRSEVLGYCLAHTLVVNRVQSGFWGKLPSTYEVDLGIGELCWFGSLRYSYFSALGNYDYFSNKFEKTREISLDGKKLITTGKREIYWRDTRELFESDLTGIVPKLLELPDKVLARRKELLDAGEEPYGEDVDELRNEDGFRHVLFLSEPLQDVRGRKISTHLVNREDVFSSSVEGFPVLESRILHRF